MVGVLQSIWRLMTGEVIRSTEIKIHNGQTKLTLALRRAKSGALFASMKQRAGVDILQQSNDGQGCQ